MWDSNTTPDSYSTLSKLTSSFYLQEYPFKNLQACQNKNLLPLLFSYL